MRARKLPQVYHNNCGLMARAKLEDAGPSEELISVDYFPIWGCGNMVRMADDGVRTEPCNNSLAWKAGTYLQFEAPGATRSTPAKALTD